MFNVCGSNLLWSTFLNTIGTVCDPSASPSWYAQYSDIDSMVCGGLSNGSKSVEYVLTITMIAFAYMTGNC